MDSWKPEQLKAMECGGNGLFERLLQGKRQQLLETVRKRMEESSSSRQEPEQKKGKRQQLLETVRKRMEESSSSRQEPEQKKDQGLQGLPLAETYCAPAVVEYRTTLQALVKQEQVQAQPQLVSILLYHPQEFC
eukprot:TRINITY_DN14224_c0_g1_i1.p1 TRINITY_DN14224_c0_g1~~TRINITY_DN14224_c0_g1_i1.p1  ORF type:complete len:134 (+),score=31.67 TRINITY_DN14224_c0_g1_i1:96-497(+)